MTNHPNLGRRHRARSHMEAAGVLYPAAFQFIDTCRADKGKGLPDWPNWCFAPIAASYAAVCDDAGLPSLAGRIDLVSDVARIAAIAAWRPSQAIYRFDHDLYQSLITTSLTGDMPSDVLHHMPGWCQYIETPGLLYIGLPLAGVFAHLEWDANTGREELRLLLDIDMPEGFMLLPSVIHLHVGTVAECIDASVAEAKRQAVFHGMTAGLDKMESPPVDDITPVVSLVLYLCSEGADYQRPPDAQAKRTKKGWRMFPADKPTVWDVGVRIGAAIRRGREQSASEVGEGGGGAVRPHVRRAHWHTFWTGLRESDQRKPVLKWVAMTGVNMQLGDDTPSVIRGVNP